MVAAKHLAFPSLSFSPGALFGPLYAPLFRQLLSNVEKETQS